MTINENQNFAHEFDDDEQRRFIPAYLFPSLKLGHWIKDAACGGRRDLDFTEPDRVRERQCKAICSRCPVRVECLDSAMRNREPIGIWGGLNTDERVELARRRRLPEPKALPPHGTNPRYVRHGCRCIPCRQAHTRTVAENRRQARRRAEERRSATEGD